MGRKRKPASSEGDQEMPATAEGGAETVDPVEAAHEALGGADGDHGLDPLFVCVRRLIRT